MTTLAPLRKIIDRPSQLVEHLECGHMTNRPCALGEDLQKPSKAKRRRCYICETCDAANSY